MKSWELSVILGKREGFLSGYLGHVDRAERLNTEAIKSDWWYGILLASCMAACPFLFLVRFESMTLRVVFIVMFLWSIWFLCNRVFVGFRGSDFVKAPPPKVLGLWETEFPAVTPFLRANDIHSHGCSEFEFELVRQWVSVQRRHAAAAGSTATTRQSQD